MADFCDRSPCKPLISALGNYIFGGRNGFAMIVQDDQFPEGKEIRIQYCPFCGTRLEEVASGVVLKAKKPKALLPT